MATRLPIDDLLDALSQTSSTSSQQQSSSVNRSSSNQEFSQNISHSRNNASRLAQNCSQNRSQNSEDSVRTNQPSSNSASHNSLAMSSSQTSQRDINNAQNVSRGSQSPRETPRRMTQITRNLSSSSLRRRTFKPVNCFFCNRYKVNRSQLEEHLNNSITCLNLYQRKFRVKELIAVLLKMYRCICCEAQGSFQLKRHLEINRNCFQYYKDKLQVLDWDQLRKRIINLTRHSQPSRSRTRRRIEYSNYQQRIRAAKTVTESLNSFKRDTALGKT